MPLLALITNLSSGSTDRAFDPHSMAAVAALLKTPLSFWVVIVLGIAASPWMVKPPANLNPGRHIGAFAAAALFFLAAILLFDHVRARFVSIFADLFETPEQLFAFPFALGASPIGAALLVLTWYYVHPVSRLQADPVGKIRTIYRAFAPMILTFVGLGLAMMMSLTMRML